MEKKEIWLRNKNGGSYKEERFKLFGYYHERLWDTDGNIEPLVGIVRYYKNNKGEWERCEYGHYYITLSTLLTEFIAIDTVFDQELNKLTEQLADIWKENLENTFQINGTLGDPIKPEDIGVEVIPQAEERNINDDEWFTSICIRQSKFIQECKDLQDFYPNITFFGGNRKYDWKEIYHFDTDVQLKDLYSSTTNIFGGPKDHWTAKLDDLWPWLYAKLRNKKNIRNHKNEDGILFIDYVNIK